MIAARLNAEGTPTPRGPGGPGASVLRILQCSAYAALIRWKGRLLPAAHDPVIDRRLWDQAQRLLAAQRRRRIRPRSGPRGPRRAGRRHPPDRLAAWVFLQHQVWSDWAGVEHEIESMPLPYVQAVIRFCHERAYRILTIVNLEVWERRWRLGVPLTDLPDPLDWSPAEDDASEWLEQTAVMIALRLREELLNAR